MKPFAALVIISLLTVSDAIAADVVVDWNEIAVATAAAGKHAASEASRTTALVHAAMFDAVNAIGRRYTPYKVAVAAPAGASEEAAGIAAAHAALVRLYPEQKGALDEARARSLGRVADADARLAGIAVGEQVGAEMVALRARDGAVAPNTYRPVTS